MKFWLIAFLFTADGEYIDKREVVYENEVKCLTAMNYVKPPRRDQIVQMVCVSDDHHSGRKKDPGVDYD